jgi:flagellar biosynthesis protein
MKRSEYRRAIGLSYQPTDGAPTIGVHGESFEADEVVRIARRYGVPVVENETLAQALKHYEVDDIIPPELYRAVAVLFSSLTTLSGQVKPRP